MFPLRLILDILIDLSRDELALAKRYPPHTALCIRDGWELCRPEHAAGIIVLYSLLPFTLQNIANSHSFSSILCHI